MRLVKQICLLFVLSTLAGACASLDDDIANDCNEAQCDDGFELAEEYQRFHKIQVDIQSLRVEDANKSFSHPMSLTYTSYLQDELITEELVFLPNNDEYFKEIISGESDIGDKILNGRFSPFLNFIISDDFVVHLNESAPAECDGVPYSIALRVADRDAQHNLAPAPLTGIEATTELINPNFESKRYTVCLDNKDPDIMDVFSQEWGKIVRKYFIDYYNKYDTTTNG